MEKLRNGGHEFLAPSTMVQTMWALGQPTYVERQLHRLRDISRFCRRELARFGVFVHGDGTTPVLPVHVGRASVAARLSYILRCRGLPAIPISTPAVPFWESRVRINLSAEHDDEDINKLLDAVISGTQSLGIGKRTKMKRREYKYAWPSALPHVEEQEAAQTFNQIRQLIDRTAADLADNPITTIAGSRKSSKRFVVEAGHSARARYGICSGGARWICGTQVPHLAVEDLVANTTGTDKAMIYPDACIGIASTLAALSRPPLGCKKHSLLVPDEIPPAAEDGLVIAPRKNAPKVVRYKDFSHLTQLITGLSHNKVAKKTYLTIYLHIPDSSTLTQLASTLSSLNTAKHPSAGMTLLIHSPYSLVTSQNLAGFKPLPNVQILACGSIHHTFGLAGGYLAGSESLIQELRYTSRGYMYTTSNQPFVMDMIRVILEKELETRN
jgi:serine palmitoyltransferase